MELPKDHEDHMPPKEKRQPKKEEIQLIRLWLENKASFDLKLGAAKPEKKWLEPFFQREEIAFYPSVNLTPVVEDSLAALRKKGFYVEPIAKDSPLLKVSCINFPDFIDQNLQDLSALTAHVVYLDLSGTQVTDEILKGLTDFPNLTVLKLSQTAISGNSLNQLGQSQQIKLIFLNQTKVSLSQIQSLASIQSLEKVFAFDTPTSSELQTLGNMSLPFLLETGSYLLPKIPSDTIVY